MQDQEIAATPTVTICGAGLAGSLMAIYLARRGFQVEVFERSGDPRKDQAPAGRSINLALAERGIDALRGVGLHHRVARFALPMRGRMVHGLDSEPLLQPYGQSDSEVIYSVHRARLNTALLDAAESTRRVRIHFSQELLELNLVSGMADFLDHASGRRYQRPVQPLIGADGAGSAVREALARHLEMEVDARLLDHGYLELTVPPGPGGRHMMDPAALHIWPRGNYMMIALPNADGSFTNTLFLASTGDPSFNSLDSFDRFHRFMAAQFPDAMASLSMLEQDYHENPVGIMGTIRCPHWHAGGEAVLIGDAAHALVPFHGQGMNCAFEDCAELDRCVAESATWDQAFSRFQRARRGNADAIADMALENYLEMRDAVLDPGYVLRRALEQELERRHPDQFVPRYSMVMFRRIPYALAQQRGRTNLEILRKLTSGVERLDDVDYVLASRLVQQLEPLEPEAPNDMTTT
ncbi:MAG: NAD(P)/FAD-dependent oxidoreductase [Xanthomonadales bacterium]|nr:NAD(P)/FAD-dependent oxidoreductase [Xanthomonadales bacterium]